MNKLDSFHMMIVSQYLTSIEDFVNLEFFHNNPIPLTTKTIKFFDNLETLNVWNKHEETFGNDLLNEKKPISQATFNFFKINVWFEVDYKMYKTSENDKVCYKNIVYTINDVLTFGEDIPLNVKKLGIGAFKQTERVEFNIPNNVIALDELCFNGIDKLSQITFSKN
ncbi:hypothetical protein EIN_337900 [Entamoeba invadens IP1]|uniref:Leucine rich repeat containing protein BspA family protein n=1 Tax=Entamoeba invadens IP1 TaxID=370355 RepID=A0A0A1TV60_ENTIV|nr:hypothetical protein EIN_337900 [Entamoeba invadens IP1]ELP84171.1 hypothetical protein EIN_337900 [Entamoeba invadens IP1]|eukprot:XP_004183517.1 hypothetical protein EIN_337900 [Entamoeba invadens IP1]